MGSIIESMKRIGLDVNKEGVCQGIAMMAIQAYLLGPKEFQHYSERFENLIQSEPVQPIRYESHDAPDWDTQAFLQGIALYQTPECYPAFLPSNKPFLLQSNVEEIAVVIQSNLTQKRGGIRAIYSFTGLYNSDKEINKYLQSYQQAVTVAQIDGEESHCALLLRCYNHAIMLAYDVHSGWYLQSHDNRYVLNGEALKSVVKQIRESYRISFPDGVLILSTTVYSLGEAFSVANKVCDLWRDNADWKQMHDVTVEKVKIIGYGGWIYIAAKTGDLEMIKTLLDKGADVNATTEDGVTPLYEAAQNGHLEVVQILFEKGADVNAARDDGATPLHLAVQKGDLDMLKTLLAKGADVNAARKDGATPLHLGTKNNHLKVVKVLIDNGADINAATENGATSLHVLAEEKGDLKMLKALLDKGADVNVARKDGATPLHLETNNSHLEAVEVLIDNGANVNVVTKDGVTPLLIAAQKGNLDVIKILLKKGADVLMSNNAKTEVLHQMAITQGLGKKFLALNKKLSAKKLSTGGRVPNFSPLDAALFCCHPETAMVLINAGAQTNQGHTPHFYEWLLYASQGASESYKQLKEFFEPLIKLSSTPTARSSVYRTSEDESDPDISHTMRTNFFEVATKNLKGNQRLPIPNEQSPFFKKTFYG